MDHTDDDAWPPLCPFCDVAHSDCSDATSTADMAAVMYGDASSEATARLLAHLVQCRACCEAFASMVADATNSDDILAGKLGPLALELGEALDRLEYTPPFAALVRTFREWLGQPQPHHET